jgi:hypothetical protein
LSAAYDIEMGAQSIVRLLASAAVKANVIR